MILQWCLKFKRFIMRYIPLFLKQTANTVQIHPTFLALKDAWNSLLLIAKQLNEHYNPLIDSEESNLLTDSKQGSFLVDSKEEDLNATSPVCKDESFLRDLFLVASLISLAIVAIRCFWSKRSTENKCLEEIQIEKRKTFKDDCSSLRELYKVLLCLKHYIKVLPENRKTSPFIMNSVSNNVREMTSRSLYSNISRKQIAESNIDREDNFEKLRENLQKAILMLEEQINFQSKMVDDTEIDYRDIDLSMEEKEAMDDVYPFPKYPTRNSESIATDTAASHIDLKRLQEHANSKQTMFLLGKQMDVKSFVTDDADIQKPTEPCKDCSKLKEALLFLKQQFENKPFKSNVSANCNSTDESWKCFKPSETQNSMVLNMARNRPPSSQKRCDCEILEANGTEASANIEGNILHVNSNTKTLNIEILFNRNIQLEKVLKGS